MPSIIIKRPLAHPEISATICAGSRVDTSVGLYYHQGLEIIQKYLSYNFLIICIMII